VAALDYIVAAIPMLGLLIFVHEFGHFIVAKMCGVRVLKFSLGFGSPIGFGRHRLRWERGGTEYVIAWIPLGGFVRMLGEQMPGEEGAVMPIPDDARPDEFLDSKPTWQKLAIFFAGPGMNLALPVLLFSVMLWAGIPKTTSVVGMVERGSPAEEAGLLAGDTIVGLDGEPVRWWSDVARSIRERGPGQLDFELERDGTLVHAEVVVGTRSALDPFGSARTIGWVGIGSQRLPALIGIPDGSSPAAQAGLLSGDRIVGLNGEPVEEWEGLRKRYAATSGNTVAIEVIRGLDEDSPEFTFNVPALGDLDVLGLVSATILVGNVVPETPAERAGLAKGDLILAVDGRPVGSFQFFADTVRASEGRSLDIAYARDGAVVNVDIQPVEREIPGPFGIEGMEEKVYQVGIEHALATLPGVQALDQERNPLVSVPRALTMTGENIAALLEGLGKLVTFQLGSDQLRGPITIIQIARKSLDLGWQAYLITMIFISLNLGLLNLLPIPILDGGQILIASIEGIKRSPISIRTREVVQQVGFVMLICMMGLALRNDLAAQWSKFVEWLSTAS
jgi:regulator of sigma E protease